ncbi:class I SAM-dependent methyltransferase [Dactylosporangium sp. NPDC000555]|uniref:class I SAM-dependent methyltransferase n=1 Tax=Dactylosporangium sp. NPDC000555 TaxID=3154260 RepID=UPI00331AB720
MAHEIPVTRRSILEHLLAYKRTAVLRTALELRLFDAVQAGHATPAAVGAATGVPERSVRVLLAALAAAGLVVEDGGADAPQYGLPDGAERLLVSTSADYAGGAALVAASQLEWESMGRLTGIVRAGTTPLPVDAGSAGFPYWQDFAEHGTFATHQVADAVTDAVAGVVDDSAPLHVLDLGCGHAIFGLALARRFPGARLTAFDRDDILPHARKNGAATGLSSRTTFVAGDAFQTDLGGPYDVVVLANLLPQFDPHDGVRLLRRAATVLAPGGRVVVAGFTVGDDEPAREYGARMLSLLMLAWTRGGEVPTSPGYLRMLAAAGLDEVEAHDLPGLPSRLFLARPGRG